MVCPGEVDQLKPSFLRSPVPLQVPAGCRSPVFPCRVHPVRYGFPPLDAGAKQPSDGADVVVAGGRAGQVASVGDGAGGLHQEAAWWTMAMSLQALLVHQADASLRVTEGDEVFAQQPHAHPGLAEWRVNCGAAGRPNNTPAGADCSGRCVSEGPVTWFHGF